MTPEELWMAFDAIEEDTIQDALQPVERTHRPGRRRLAALLTAAVIASTLIMTAFASEDGSLWFRNFFRQESSQELSDPQKAYIDENTIQPQQSQTVNGYTLTLESAITDGNRTFLQCRLTAPEGVVLDADHYGDKHSVVFQSKDQDNDLMMGGYGWEKEDDDPTDNQVTLLFRFECHWADTNTVPFTDQTWEFLVYGLEGTYYEGEGMDMTIRDVSLAEGLWAFDIRFPEGSDREIQFISEPVDCPAKVNMGITQTGENTFMFAQEETNVQVTSLTLRSLSADFYYQYSEKDSVNADFEEFYVVMKDGSQILMQQSAGMPNYNGYQFDAPIILEDVDHILLPNGTRLIPQVN